MKKIKKASAFTAGFMVAATLLAKICGMFRDILMANLYGTSTDAAMAFSAASRIPLLFFDIALGSAVTSAFIPVFNEYIAKGKEEDAFNFANCFINLIILITVVISGVGIVFSAQVATLFAGGLEASALHLSSVLIKILFPTIIFTGVAYCFVGVLQSYGEFLIPAIISLVSNAILILYIAIFGNRFGIHGVAIAMLIAWASQCIIQIPSLVKMKYRYKPTLNFKNEGIKNVCKLALPIILSTWMQPINTMINIRLASSLNGGEAMTALDYANKLYIILVGVFTFTATNLIFPSLSRAGANDDGDKFNFIISKAVRYVVFIIAPVMVGFLLLSTPIIRLFYERGEFDAQSTALTSTALFCYSFGMLGYGMQEMANKGFYALHDGKTPMKVAFAGIVVNIVLSIVLVAGIKVGLGGLAISASVAANVIGFTMIYKLHKRTDGILTKEFGRFGFKILISVFVMAIAVFAANRITYDMNKLLAVAIPVTVGVITYFVTCAVCRVSEIGELLNIVKTLMKRGRKE
ncbi:MAG: murein biosynthesis integral membrane protein MurJ [Clostridia bacterium]|nr:murein biosynthesis integral membrane protein MurJ [Clostridia bacterium]